MRKKLSWNDIIIEDDEIEKNNDNLHLSEKTSYFSVTKADEDKKLVFGWALVSAGIDGQQIVDSQGDIVDPEDLEDGAYQYVLNFRDAGEEHIGSLRKKARMVESVVFTDEKLQAMGIPAGTVPCGWWIGFYVDDDETWKKIKDGTYRMFSIEGRAVREPVQNIAKSGSETVFKTFSELAKFNPYHDRLGRFTTAGGASSFTIQTRSGLWQGANDKAIQREKERTANMKPSYSSKITGATYDMPKLESEEAEQYRKKALDHVEQYYSRYTPVKEKYDEQMKRYLEETDTKEWQNRSRKDVFSIGHNFLSAKTPTERAEEAVRRKQKESKDRAFERAARKETPKYQEYKKYLKSMYDKYSEQMRSRMKISPYDLMTMEESEKLSAMREATVKQGKNGMYRVAKSFSELMKFNPYHDRLGRFTTGGGYGISSSLYTGDKNRQAVTFSANPDTVAGAKAIDRHGGVIPTAYDRAGTKPEDKKKQTEADTESNVPTLAGVKQGEPMSFEEADHGSTNPNYSKGGLYTVNCQTCVIANEARRRGFDVTARPKDTPEAHEIAYDQRKAWIDPKTGNKADYLPRCTDVKTAKQAKKYLEENLNEGERYFLGHAWKGRGHSGHIITAYKDADGIKLYDPQTGKNRVGKEVDDYLNLIKYKRNILGSQFTVGIKVLRVDDKEFNKEYVDKILVKGA